MRLRFQPRLPALRVATLFGSFAFFPYSIEQLTDGHELGRRAWAAVLTSLRTSRRSWTGAVSTDRPLPILDSYLRYTYQRLVMEQKIGASADGEFAALDTGLLTSHAEDVFGLFQRNTREHSQLWVFKKWATESDREILRNFPAPPPIAEYVTSASDLVYDWRRDLKFAYEHILVDNLDRFPAELSARLRCSGHRWIHALAWTLKRAPQLQGRCPAVVPAPDGGWCSVPHATRTDRLGRCGPRVGDVGRRRRRVPRPYGPDSGHGLHERSAGRET